MTLEQSIKLDSKTIVGIWRHHIYSNEKRCVDYMTQIVWVLDENEFLRDEADVQTLLRVIIIRADERSLSFDDGISSLFSIATGVVMLPQSVSRLITSYHRE